MDLVHIQLLGKILGFEPTFILVFLFFLTERRTLTTVITWWSITLLTEVNLHIYEAGQSLFLDFCGYS